MTLGLVYWILWIAMLAMSLFWIGLTVAAALQLAAFFLLGWQNFGFILRKTNNEQ